MGLEAAMTNLTKLPNTVPRKGQIVADQWAIGSNVFSFIGY